jgi:DNA gyrase subunit B
MSTEQNKKNHGSEDYGADNIKVLKGLDAVRKRPGMYIGDTDDGSGLHHMVYEVVDNAIDEIMAGFATMVDVTLNADGSVTVLDDGRGIPTGMHKDEGRSAAEVIMTVLHAGGKFNEAGEDGNAYKVSGGLHGVGVTVVNALSTWLELKIWREDKEHYVKFQNGDAVAPLKVVGPAPKGKRGSQVTFLASPATFTMVEYDFTTLEHRLRELAFLNSGAKIVLTDNRHADVKRVELFYEGGLSAYVRHLDRSRVGKLAEPIQIEGDKGGITCEVALWWNDAFNENTLCFTNNIPQRDGGTHLAGFRAALTRVIQKYYEESGAAKREKIAITGDDAREGLCCVLSVKVPDPKFSSQTKGKLVSSEVKSVVETVVGQTLAQWFEEHPTEAKVVIAKVVQAAQTRVAVDKIRNTTRKGVFEGQSLPGGLAECQDRNPVNTELFIVEGDSAGGSAKQGRKREYQAVLPIRGKILNVERARIDRMLSSEQVTNIIGALGTGIGRDRDGNSAFKLEKLRYHKIIIMTDADVDGAHIRTLLLTFFYRQMPELVENGHLYIAQPPLYKVAKGKSETYLKDQEALEDYLIDTGLDDATLKLGSGEVRAKRDLNDAVRQSRNFQRNIDALRTRYNRGVIEQAAIGGALDPAVLADAKKAEAVVAEVVVRLDAVSEETERGWTGRLVDGGDGFMFTRVVRGVKEAHHVDRALILSADARKLHSVQAALHEIFETPGVMARKDTEIVINGPLSLLKAVYDIGRKGLSLQRYKGLGEMNPEQLWETTLDKEVRTLLQVKVGDIAMADDIFSKLMGDVVEPRREFIQANALNASVDV